MVTWQYQLEKQMIFQPETETEKWLMEPWDPQKTSDAARTGYFTENLPQESLNQSTLFTSLNLNVWDTPKNTNINIVKKKIIRCSKLNSHHVFLRSNQIIHLISSIPYLSGCFFCGMLLCYVRFPWGFFATSRCVAIHGTPARPERIHGTSLLSWYLYWIYWLVHRDPYHDFGL